MKTNNNMELMETDQILLIQRIVFRPFLVKFGVILLFILTYLSSEAQPIKVPNMLVGGDTWGLIDVNNLYGGCMQVDTYDAMINTDVQFLKRGMLFVVYDNDLSTPGPQTKIYIFSPPMVKDAAGKDVSFWAYNTPFEIPASDKDYTISDIGLQVYLYPLNISPNTDPEKKTNVYYDSSDFQFYKYDESTNPAKYVIILPKAESVSVVAKNGITSTNVQSALEELQSKISTNALRFETSVVADGVVNYPVGFTLNPNSQVFFNSVLLDYPTQWTTGATTSDLKLLVATLVHDKIKIQR